MARKDLAFPINNDMGLVAFLRKVWKDGWLDEYSDKHFLIQALEGRVSKIQWEEQLINNNIAVMYAPIKNGTVDYNSFSRNFIINISQRLSILENTFGEKQIKNFICHQLAAGKQNYNRDQFFQALSEIEILSFYSERYKWTNPTYEPTIGRHGTNPEASFEAEFKCSNNGLSKKVRINIEVKTPKFPDVSFNKKRVIVPTVLLTEKGKTDLEELCKIFGYTLLLPRVTKLVDFINSAVSKFNDYSDNVINILYVNWSYSDFPSNGFLEAWSILTNEVNGLLTCPDCVKLLNLSHPLSEEVKRKITAVVVYTSSLEQLMFSNFRYSWQRSPNVGPRFRMYVIDEKLRIAELEDSSSLLFKITGMNPDMPKDKEWRLLVNNGKNESTDFSDQANDCMVNMLALDIINKNILNVDTK